MAFKSVTLALTGAAQRLSDAYGGAAGVANPVTDITYRALYLQGLLANTGNIFVGDSNLVSSTNHGFRVSAVDGDPPVRLEPASPGSPLHLSDFWVIGTNGETLCIGGIPL